MKKDKTYQLQKRVMDNTVRKAKLMVESDKIKENPMAAYKFPGRITFGEIKKPPNTGIKAPKERYST